MTLLLCVFSECSGRKIAFHSKYSLCICIYSLYYLSYYFYLSDYCISISLTISVDLSVYPFCCLSIFVPIYLYRPRVCFLLDVRVYIYTCSTRSNMQPQLRRWNVSIFYAEYLNAKVECVNDNVECVRVSIGCVSMSVGYSISYVLLKCT